MKPSVIKALEASISHHLNLLVILALILVPLLRGTAYAYLLRHRGDSGDTYPPEVR